MRKVPKEKLVYVDEMGVNLGMTPTMARAPIGERAFGTVPSMHVTNLSVVAAIRNDEVLAWYPHDGAINEERFVAFIEEKLAPKLRVDDVVIMDNVRFHKGDKVKEIIKSVGARVLFTPSYHPEMNAIEEAFSVVKRAVRRFEPRTIVAMIEALTQAFVLLTAEKLSAFIEHMLTFAIQQT